jgi:hypothetical protein
MEVLNAKRLEDFRARLHERQHHRISAWRKLREEAAMQGVIRFPHGTRRDCDFDGFPYLVSIRGQDTTVDQRMLQFIRQIKGIGESEASGQQPNS